MQSLLWLHNGRDSVSNHQPHDCLLNRLFRRRSKKTSKLRVAGLCAGNSPGTGEFSAQMASYAENVSIWWRHHDKLDHVYVQTLWNLCPQKSTFWMYICIFEGLFPTNMTTATQAVEILPFAHSTPWPLKRWWPAKSGARPSASLVFTPWWGISKMLSMLYKQSGTKPNLVAKILATKIGNLWA